MDCNVAKQLMTDCLMGMTDESVKTEFEEHLAGCEKCRSAFEELKKAEQEYNKKEGAEPLKKVNKVIKKHKRGKILAILGAAVLAVVLLILIVGEINPKSGLPSITRLKYKHKAEKILDALFTNDMELLLTGSFADIIPGTDGFTFSKAKCVEDMIVDYSKQLKKFNEGFLNGKGYDIKSCRVQYEEGYQTYLGRLHPYTEEYKNYVYEVYMEVNSIGRFYMHVFFIDENHYYIQFGAVPDAGQEFRDKMNMIMVPINQVEMVAKGIDWKQYVINGRMLGDNGYINVGNNLVSDDCIRPATDETYLTGFNERLSGIYNTGKTVSVDIVIRDYNFEKHAINTELIWVIMDENGKSAVMRKKLLYGPFGYQKLDDEADFISDPGFDIDLKEKLRTLF